MDPLNKLAAGVSAIALGSIANSLVPISESAQNFNYCVEQKTAWWKEKDGKPNPRTCSNRVAFYNGKVNKQTVSDLRSM